MMPQPSVLGSLGACMTVSLRAMPLIVFTPSHATFRHTDASGDEQ